jgi:imidazolonepropionase-like amidohydrolase
MKRYLLFVSSFLITLFSLAQNKDFQPHIGIKDKLDLPEAFLNTTIHLDSKTTLKDAILVIKNGKIINVGNNISIPKNAIIHNLKGKHIYPSFIELVSDLNIVNEKKKEKSYSPQYTSSKKGPYHWNEAVRPEYNSIENIDPDFKSMKGYLNKGYGMVVSHQKNGIVRGSGALIMLTKEFENIFLLDKAASFYSFNKGNSNQAYPSSLMGSIALLRQFFIDSRWYKEYKSEKKSKINLSYESQIDNENLPKIFILDNKLDLFRANKIAQEANIDFIYKGNGREYENISQIKNINPKLIVPLNFPKPMDLNNPYDGIAVSTSDLSHWKYAATNIQTLEKEEISFCITSSNLNSKAFFKAIRQSIYNNASKEQILYSLTELPAKWLGINNQCGTLNKGMIANFLITEKELFDKNSKIVENWVVGKKQIDDPIFDYDVRGTYTLVTENKNKELLVSGSSKSPKVTLIYNVIRDSINNGDIVLNDKKEIIKTKKEKKENVSFSRGSNKVSLSYKEGDNFLRLDGVIEDGSHKWSGEGQDKNGDWFNWSAIRTPNKDEIKKDSTNKKTNAIKYINNQHLDFCSPNYPKFDNIIFKNATIWTADNLETFVGDLWIKNGKIISVGVNISYDDKNVNIIDLDGKHISPGIIDEHSHIAIQNGVNEGSNAITSEVRIGDVINPEDINIYRQLSGGVTAAQLLHGSANPVGGQSAIIKMRWGQTAERMKIKSAPGFIKFALGENVKQSNWGWRYSVRYPQTRMGVEQIYYDAFTEAKEYQLAINNYNTLSKKKKADNIEPKRNLQLEALSEIVNKKRFITCHSYIQSEINMLMKMADSMGFKINTFTHILEGYKVADKMKEHGAGASTFSDWWAYKFEVRDAIPYNACLLSQMGIITAINSDDAEMGRRLNQEASKAIKYGGCSENEALKLVTINPAKLLHIDHITGSIKKGKDADLVIWDGPPLSIYSKVEKTYVDGRLLYDHNTQNKLFLDNESRRSSIITEMINAKKNGAVTQSLKKQINKVHKCNDFEIEQ